MSNNRENLLKKIRALMSKTVENGCTEAEAMSALSMAQAMMDAYEISEADLNEIKQESAIKETMHDMRDPHYIRTKICVAISKFTHTKVWSHEYKSQKYRYNFVGLRGDVDFAMWLTETLTMFVQKELKNYIWANGHTSLPPAQKRIVINGFVMGCCNRISARLLNLVENATVSDNKNALIVIQNQLIEKKMGELGVNLRKPRERGSRIHGGSYEAGKAAGDKANFGRPVNGKSAVLRIGN